MTDYIATGRVVPERIAAIVKGIAEACVEAGCALIGGETAEHPGLLEPDEYDVAGATTGVVEADELLGPGRVRPGDVVIAMEASGLHSNGYSLVRHVLLEKARDGRSTATSPSSAARSARSCSSPPGSTPRPASRSPTRDRHPRDVPRHRRRPGRQPRAGDAGRGSAPPSTGDLDPAADLRPGAPGRLRLPGRPRDDPQLRRRDGRRDPARRRRRGDRAARRARVRAWVAGEVAVDPEPPAAGRLDGSAPRLVRVRSSESVPCDIGRVCGNSQPAGSVAITRN